MSSEVTVLVLTPSTISGLGSADKARLDELGAKSGVAQKLRGPITSVALMSEEVRRQPFSIRCLYDKRRGGVTRGILTLTHSLGPLSLASSLYGGIRDHPRSLTSCTPSPPALPPPEFSAT